MSIIKKLASASGILGGVAAAGLLAMTVYLSPDSMNGRGSRAIALPFAVGFMCSSMVTGIALLFAPYSFFASKQGRSYLWAIGTHNTFVARLLVAIGLALGCGVIWLLWLWGRAVVEELMSPPEEVTMVIAALIA